MDSDQPNLKIHQGSTNCGQKRKLIMSKAPTPHLQSQRSEVTFTFLQTVAYNKKLFAFYSFNPYESSVLQGIYIGTEIISINFSSAF
jgi:hypothetical protein